MFFPVKRAKIVVFVTRLAWQIRYGTLGKEARLKQEQ